MITNQGIPVVVAAGALRSRADMSVAALQRDSDFATNAQLQINHVWSSVTLQAMAAQAPAASHQPACPRPSPLQQPISRPSLTSHMQRMTKLSTASPTLAPASTFQHPASKSPSPAAAPVSIWGGIQSASISVVPSTMLVSTAAYPEDSLRTPARPECSTSISGAGLTCIAAGNVSYSVASGTSYAAPHVAGVAAIFLEGALLHSFS